MYLILNDIIQSAYISKTLNLHTKLKRCKNLSKIISFTEVDGSRSEENYLQSRNFEEQNEK